MQKIYAWLRPRHYSVHSGSTRRLNSRGLLNGLAPLGITLLVLPLARGFRFVAPPTRPANAQVVVVSAPAEHITFEAALPSRPLKQVSNYAAVGSAVQQWVKAHGGSQWGVVVQDLNDADNKVDVNADSQFDSASLYKLFLTIPLAQRLPFASWSTQHTLNGQGDHTIAQCVQAMLAWSDNPCGMAIGSLIGWSNATRSAHANGFTNTSLSYSPIQTTASNVADYLVGLNGGKWFDAQTRDFILNSLAMQKFRAGIPTGCTGCTVFNKTGQLNGVTHDAAIVTRGKKHYVLVIMSKGGSYSQIAELTKLINATLL